MRDITRRDFVRGVGAAAAALVVTPIISKAARSQPLRPPVAPDLFPKIGPIRSPLATVPSIVEAGAKLHVELEAARAEGISAALVPSFGTARVPRQLVLLDAARGPSALWHGNEVVRLTFAVPEIEPGRFVEDLYDLHVSWGAGRDVQPRAVKVVEHLDGRNLRIVVVADPSVADPRPVQEGAEDLANFGDTDSLTYKTWKTLGAEEGGTWGAFRRVIDEVNAAAPDLVLLAGDLTFAFYPRPINYEYEEAYRLVNLFRVPTFATPGNHDLYHLDYDDVDRPHTTDGKELWPLYFGPLHWSADVGGLHLVSMNTYDWPDVDREPIRPEDGSTRSGGYVSDDQLAWVAEDLRAFRARDPDGPIVTFAHHDPSWRGRRHPWPGLNRLELRDLFAETRVGAHFAGHTHDDRIARYHEGNIVETNGNNSFPRRELHYMRRDDSLDDSWTQDDLAAIVRDPANGPVFVNTTTAASGLKGPDWGLGSYWGYRLADLAWEDGYDPNRFGYPATEEFLAAHAERPENYNADHAPLGVFSYPSYFLDVKIDDDAGPATLVRVTSRLLVDLPVVVPVSMDAADTDVVVAEGADLLRRRTSGRRTDVWLGILARAGSTTEAAAVNRGPGG